LLIKEHLGRFTPVTMLEAAIGALAVTALGSAVLTPALAGLDRGDTAAVATNLAYPVLDLALLAMIAAGLVLGRPREAGNLLLVGLGLLIWAVADGAYLFLEAKSNYEPGLIDLTWQLGALAIAGGALFAPRRAPTEGERRPASLLVVASFTTMAVAVLVWDHFERLRGISIILAAATLLAVAVRLGLSYRENERLLRELHDENVTDALTGLGNRRRLFLDLERALGGSPRSSSGFVFALFDLDGFKAYNDAFGHPAGDALLRRLGASVAESVNPHGSAYRLGGDEFCVLVAVHARRPASIFEAAREALKEEGEGFSIGASGGWLLLAPGDCTVEEALRDADRRMYAEKTTRSSATERQTQDVLMRIFREREPALGDHSEGVADLCVALGRRLDLDAEEQDVLGRAAELHDIGKIAIPDEILHKPGPLDDAEWDLMRRHTLIGDRILGATPALRPVARLVRASHERWDGNGYPDGRAGEDIPLGARIICICDAFDAMTSERSYKEPVRVEDALAELRRCAGSHFDPQLVDLFVALIEDRRLGRESPRESPSPAGS
jgi:diguanylate cyclase (GGDEF)-like protein